jgi:glycine/D-amino acid oxidase-like deaminating enzyme
MNSRKNWGTRPWVVDFHTAKHELPAALDFAVVGGGFTGLAAAAWLKKISPEKTVALFEAETFGSGASGHTGGVALAESAVGDLPGLGDVLAGYREILRELNVDADLTLPGCYELGRTGGLPNTPIRWKDEGMLSALKEVPGGTINPGKTVSGLARAAERAGVLLFEATEVEEAKSADEIHLTTSAGVVRAKYALFATNAFALELSSLRGRAQAAFTTAVMTEPLTDTTLAQIGLFERKPFYTVDLPYLWGRLHGDAVIFGSGLIFFDDWRALRSLTVDQGELPGLFARLESRIRGLHPALREVKFTHRWGGPICIADEWKPVFEKHPNFQNAIVLGGYSGHGVAQSVYLGAWAAEALLGKRELPKWR